MGVLQKIARRLPRRASYAIVGAVTLLIVGAGAGIAVVSSDAPFRDARFEAFKGACETNGPAYGQPRNRPADREAVFGKPNDPAKLVSMTFFGQQVRVHEKVAPCLAAVERDLRDQQTPYVVRAVSSYREDRPYWFHAYGAAIDINPSQNPQCLPNGGGLDPQGRCDSPMPYDIPREWIETFERYGFFWGGDFRRSADYMHFEWHGEGP
jgi:hypothetical protein